MWEWETAVVLIQDDSGQVLLVHQDYGLRLFGLPGGKVEPGETPEQAARRELEEETGLGARSLTPLGTYDLTYPGSGGRYRSHAYRGEDLSGELLSAVPGEISSVGWYELDALPAPLTPSSAAVLGALSG